MLSSIACCWVWSWADLVITVIGSFLGFFSAILAAFFTNWIIDLKHRRSVINKICLDIKTHLEKNSADSVKENIESCDIQYGTFVNIPYLEQVITYSNLKTYKKLTVYNELVELHLIINSLNSLYAARTEFFMKNYPDINLNDNPTNYTTATKILEELSQEITAQYLEFYNKAQAFLKNNKGRNK